MVVVIQLRAVTVVGADPHTAVAVAAAVVRTAAAAAVRTAAAVADRTVAAAVDITGGDIEIAPGLFPA